MATPRPSTSIWTSVAVLIVLWVMTMVSVLILHWIGVIVIDTSGSVGQLTIKAAGAAAFVIVFMILLVQLLKQIPRAATFLVRIQDFLR